MSSNVNWVKRGVVVGSGAAKKVVLGFKPAYVELFNSAAGGLTSAWKTETMDGAFAKKQVPAGTVTFADDMVTLESDGFTVGDDADLNAAGETIHYVAHQARNE